MKYGIYMPNFGLGGEARTLADLASEAEECGWHGFFIWDHIQWPGVEPCVDPWIALTAIAMQTERMALGPLVTPLPRRDIGKLARETISLDRLSGGRLVLGVGLGWHTIPEWSGFGHEEDLKIRGEMLDEGLELLNALWSGAPVDHAGKYYRVQCEAFMQPVQTPRIPIWVGGTWPSVKPFRRAARWDGVMPIHKKVLEGEKFTTEDLGEVLDLIRGQGKSLAGYEVIKGGVSNDAADDAEAKLWTEAGATWWLENVLGRMDNLAQLRDRIRKGPPTG